MSSASPEALSTVDETTSTPPSAASEQPMAQLNCATRVGCAPLSWVSAGSSTTARMVTPRRLRVRSSRRPSATRIATMMVMSWW